jgi:hypothetical protein
VVHDFLAVWYRIWTSPEGQRRAREEAQSRHETWRVRTGYGGFRNCGDSRQDGQGKLEPLGQFLRYPQPKPPTTMRNVRDGLSAIRMPRTLTCVANKRLRTHLSSPCASKKRWPPSYLVTTRCSRGRKQREPVAQSLASCEEVGP